MYTQLWTWGVGKAARSGTSREESQWLHTKKHIKNPLEVQLDIDENNELNMDEGLNAIIAMSKDSG